MALIIVPLLFKNAFLPQPISIIGKCLKRMVALRSAGYLMGYLNQLSWKVSKALYFRSLCCRMRPASNFL